jgi:hypothetical protein
MRTILLFATRKLLTIRINSYGTPLLAPAVNSQREISLQRVVQTLCHGRFIGPNDHEVVRSGAGRSNAGLLLVPSGV